uniref:Uncharacterized protein n=1 Tax=viral metagenome TaxID=1070528 RepID=A0A6H1ZBP9_9ZZZZ
MPSYSGLFDGVNGTPHSLLSDAVKIGNAQTQIARVLAKRPYGRGVLRELMLTLNGAAAGEAALDTHKRVEWTPDQEGVTGGGLVAIETFTGITRVTTADDKTDIDRMLALSSKPTTYVADAAGVGGGGKLGY